MIDKDLLEILVCPKCKKRVELHTPAEPSGAQGWLVCTDPACGLRYPIRDGIPIMLIEEAQAPGAARQ